MPAVTSPKPAPAGRVDCADVVVDGVAYRYVALHESDAASAAPLSDAERDVVADVLRGATNADIARRRGSKVRTVVNQLASVFRKLGVRSRHELVRKIAAGR